MGSLLVGLGLRSHIGFYWDLLLMHSPDVYFRYFRACIAGRRDCMTIHVYFYSTVDDHCVEDNSQCREEVDQCLSTEFALGPLHELVDVRYQPCAPRR